MEYKDLVDKNSLVPTIWSVSVSYFDPYYTSDEKPEGQRNYSSWQYFPSKYSEVEIKPVFEKMFEESQTQKDKDFTKLTDLVWNIRCMGNHRWWLTWFAHQTNQKFKTADEALQDFREFCHEQRFDQYDILNRHFDSDKFIWCPMGAEEVYRHTACNCDNCKEKGYFYIITH